MLKITKFFKNSVFQAYGAENVKFVASERRSFNIVPEMVLFPKSVFLIFDLWKMTHLSVPTNFNEMNELSNSSSKITYEVFLKRSNLFNLSLFIFESSPYTRSFIDIFQFFPLVFFSLSNLLVIIIIKIVTFYNSWLSTILYFLNVEDQLNFKNLQMKLCMRLPKFHPQYFLKLSVLYIPVHILGDFKCSLLVRFPISNVRFFLE